ncbi:uncharacterized protein [Atheta coriaria]|uniref:uncharacterized protein n=1 Tax=Dalotia coriaria TaxID=877792 RepID=UPI0031F443F9
MNKIISVVFGCCLLFGVLIHLSNAQTEQENSDCALFGGRCKSTCHKGYDMNSADARLCTGSKNNICCNPYEDRCKSQGGQCETKCQGKRTKDNTPDCKDLGMECCIYF